MEYPHTIRLRGVWGYEVLVEQSPDILSLERAGQARVPGDWGETLGCHFRGRVRYRRSFNWPSQLEPHERVWLVVDGVDAYGEAALNGQALGPVDGYALPARYDVTSLLATRNELTLDVACPPTTGEQSQRLRPGRGDAAGGPIGGVRLEVCCASSIASLTLYVEPAETPQLQIEGRVAGDGDDLALSVVVAGREVAWQTVTAGQPFTIVGAADGLPPWLDASGQAQLAAVECRLLSRGMGLWSGRRQMALPAPLPAGIFLPEGQDLQQWLAGLQTVDRTLASRRGKRALRLWSWLASPEILDDEVYDTLDRSGTRLVQGVQPDWLARVAPRLAHHPSIAAWARLDTTEESRPAAYGRRWLLANPWERADE